MADRGATHQLHVALEFSLHQAERPLDASLSGRTDDLVRRYNKDEAWEGRCDAFERVSTHVAALIGAREGAAAVIPLRG